ncbi:MAG: GDP-mannose 4,6-dehydratase [Pseudomonadota bacterium]
MKLLVTGGAGFVGNSVLRAALARGHSVINLDALTSAASLSSIWDLQDDPGYTLEIHDLCEREGLDTVFDRHRPDAVIHLAKEGSVARSIVDPMASFDANVAGTGQLLEAARAYWDRAERPPSFRLHHVSSDKVFGSLPRVGAFTDDAAVQPGSPYAAMKAAADQFVTVWGETYGLPVLISRGPSLYGPWQHPEKLIPRTLMRAFAGREIPLLGDGTQVRQWLHVEDFAQALLTITEDGEPGERYNIGSGVEMRNIDLVRAVCRLLQLRRPAAMSYAHLITHKADRPGHAARRASDDTKLRETLGWVPKTAFETGLAETVDWYLSHAGWWQPVLDKANARPSAKSGRDAA